MIRQTRLPAKDVLSYEESSGLINKCLDSLLWLSPLINEKVGHIEPPADYKRDGLLAYADGTNWNPGSGKGVYRYNSTTSTWVWVG